MRGVVVVAAVLVVVRLFWLQIAAGSHYGALADQNRIRRVITFAPRGEMFDSDGRLLVTSRPSYSIAVMPTEAADVDSVLRALSGVAGLDLSAMRRSYDANFVSRYAPVRVARDVPFSAVCRIEEHTMQLPAVFFEVIPARRYPEGGLGAHLFGTVGEVTGAELDTLAALGYVPGGGIGRKGVEAEYEQFLRGVDGARFFVVSAAGQVLGSSEDYADVPPSRGAELHLALDWDVQLAADSALVGTSGGAAVAIDPRDGGIIALASAPRFDPNALTGYVRPEEWAALAMDTTHPLLNRAISGTYPAGSTMKVVTAGTALSRGVLRVDEKLVSCVGWFTFGTRVFGCWKSGGHGSLSAHDAIVQSCDVFFYQCGLKLGVDVFAEGARGCGFGSPTGVDLPGEVAGLVPDGAYYNKRYGERGWTRGLVLNLAIGQGELLVTPIQLARLAAAVANGGTVWHPRAVEFIVSSTGDTTFVRPSAAGRLPFPDSVVVFLKDAMAGVVNEREGTAHLAAIPGVVVAGKTGTAQNPHGEDHALFIAFAPVEAPTIAVAVVVENAGHGGSVAAPIARAMIEARLGITREPPALASDAALGGPIAGD